MGTFYYKCLICGKGATYNDGDKFCSYCGNKISYNLIHMTETVEANEIEIKRLRKEIDETDAKLDPGLVEKTKKEYKTRKNILRFIEDEDLSNIAELKKADNELAAKLNMVIEKLKNEGTAGFNILVLGMGENSIFTKAPEEIYNAFMCFKDKDNYLAVDSIDPVYMIMENNIFLPAKREDKNAYYLNMYSEDEYENTCRILPPFNFQLYDNDRYNAIFDYEYSEDNKNSSKEYYILKKCCLMEKKDNYMEIKEKGNVLFVSKKEYEKLSADYNKAINGEIDRTESWLKDNGTEE